jgi:hypothetical protein
MSILDGFLDTAFSAPGWMKDQQHARALYRDDNLYDLAPKAGWIYYIRLGINPQVKKFLNATWSNRFQPFIGIMAKSADLPKFKMSTETVNQYNRKTVVQTKLTYEPVTITFHDDMANATTNLWKNYYQYYFSDGSTNISTSQRNSKTSPGFTDTKWQDSSHAYGMANGQDAPFFNSIDIFLLNKHKYTSLTLLNPIVTDWQHDSVDQTQGNKLMSSKMTVAYEAVVYGRGNARKTGFTSDHYDNSRSPLTIAGGSLLGPGGIIPGAAELIGDYQDLDQNTSFLETAGLGIRAATLIKNASKLTAAQIRQEGYSALQGQLAIIGRVGIGGYVGGASEGLGGLVGTGLTGVANAWKGWSNSSVNSTLNADSTGGVNSQIPGVNVTNAIAGTPTIPGNLA